MKLDISEQITPEDENSIAVVGMACKFPGADNPDSYWQNILDKSEKVSFFSEEELLKSNIPLQRIKNKYYVPARGILNNIEQFDAAFFGYSPYEARLMDPQHRVFLELSWTALESAGHNPDKYHGLIGVFAGMGDSSYLTNNLLKNSQIQAEVADQQMMLATSSHYLATKVAYTMGLKGPCMTVNTACSSSLVAIALACENLANYSCDMVLAGGITIVVPQQSGYLYQELGILSPDGHCRAFDNHAQGTVMSNGCGIVVLKRIRDALKDNNNIIAVIRGWAINNDGSNKTGFTAPSVQGQTECVREAIAHAGINPTEIEYLEAHGTGTLLGDPIEVTALSRGYGYETHKRSQYCAIGSVKPNIGHTDVAAGIASFIKAALALHEKILPPNINYAIANEKIDFANSPFYVNCEVNHWRTTVLKRTAAVNSLGFGGTNAHLIMQEAPEINTTITNSPNVLILSAKTMQSLDRITTNLYSYLLIQKDKKTTLLADAAYTLQLGRKHFKWRRAVSYSNYDNLLASLTEIKQLQTNTQELQQLQPQRVIFGFPGQGTQYINMAVELYKGQAFFKQLVDDSCEQLRHYAGFDLRDILFSSLNTQELNEKLQDTRYAQPALFVIEYALSQLLIKLGINPDAMIGHSVGEYVAATVAGVLTLKDALQLITMRARLMAQTAPGVMLVVPLSKEKISPFLSENISLAAHNAPNLCIVSGARIEVEKFANAVQPLLDVNNLFCTFLHVSHAFHSASMNAILDEFTKETNKLSLSKPLIPYVSNVTGNWISHADFNDKTYWTKHLRNTVLFSKGVECLALSPNDIFVEVGAGKTILQLVKQHQKENRSIGIDILPSAKNWQENAYQYFLQAIGKLWMLNQEVKWENLYLNETRKRIPLPTYVFERTSYWINPTKTNGLETNISSDELLYSLTWQRDLTLSSRLKASVTSHQCWLIFCKDANSELITKIKKIKELVYTVAIGNDFKRLPGNEFVIDPTNKKHYEILWQSINIPSENCIVLHTWSLSDDIHENVDSILQKGAYSLLFLSQAFTENCPNKLLQVLVLSNHIYNVLGNEQILPTKATLLGPCKVIPLEQNNIKFKLIDLENNKPSEQVSAISWEANIFEGSQCEIAYRGNYRWLRRIQPCMNYIKTNKIKRLQPKGVYLITGGLGGIGLILAAYLAEHYQANLILITHSDFLAEEKWPDYINNPSEKNSKIIKQIVTLKYIKAKSANLLIKQASVEDKEQMRSVIQSVMQEFGKIDGVIHAAGVPGGGVAQLKTTEEYSKVLQPKLQGTHILVDLLQNQPLDFIVFISSIFAISGFPGQIDYCSANLVLDAYALSNPFKHPVFCVSMNWQSWREVGMAADSKTRLIDLDDSNSVSPEEGAQLFEMIVNSDLNQVVISSRHPDTIHLPKITTPTEEVSIQKESGILDEISKILLELWRQILGISRVNLDDDFYELGGNSLLAISLISKIRHKFDLKIPASILFKAKTVRDLAEVIRSRLCEEEQTSLVVLQEGAKDIPALFIVHPIGGTVFCYLSLAQNLKLDRMIYGLQDPSIEKEKPLFRSIKEMASFYLAIIEQIQPLGPYYLCGASFGATLVMEIAYQLLEKGKQLNFIGLLDGWASFSQQQMDSDYLKSIVFNHQQDPNSHLLPKIADNLSLWEKMLEHRLTLMLTHKLQKISAQIILFKASEILLEYAEIDVKDNHWSCYSALPIKVYEVPGDHNTMLHEPNSLILAEHIRKCLGTCTK
jgi:acyl transferase domain-containing protein/thioesterase domain-containing protein/acyl carrier protein